ARGAQGDHPPRAATPLPPVQLPMRWIRRRVIFAGMTAAAALIPAVLLFTVDAHPAVTSLLEHRFPAPEGARAVLTVGAGLLSVAALTHALLRPLIGHLDLDRRVHAEV